MIAAHSITDAPRFVLRRCYVQVADLSSVLGCIRCQHTQAGRQHRQRSPANAVHTLIRGNRLALQLGGNLGWLAVEFPVRLPMGIVASFVDSPDLPANSPNLPPSGHYVCRATTNPLDAVRRKSFHRTRCASISRTLCVAANRTQRRRESAASGRRVVGRGRGRRERGRRAFAGAIARARGPIGRSVAIGAGGARSARVGVGREGSRSRGEVGEHARVARRASAGARRAGRIDRCPRAGTGRTRSGRRGPGDGADAGSRGSARRTREPAGQPAGRSRAARSRIERARWRT